PPPTLRTHSRQPPSPDTATHATYTLSLHDALPISAPKSCAAKATTCSWGCRMAPRCAVRSYYPRCWRESSAAARIIAPHRASWRSEEHTSELQSRFDLVCRLLLEKKKMMGGGCRVG